ncbi:hypothetical protein [Salmonella phage SE4]|uniref:hypothetical protein n=1 Tax=Salmonella phage SE4 TaxID=2575328 RepID=UPI0011D2E03B|nr:hypothetical protein HWC20_gp76 [Salmonella phage SE4]QEG07802.1 hypothetical protein [Salmonella phage SE4]
MNELAGRIHRGDLSGIADIFSAGITDSAVLRQAQRREENAERAAKAWSYQPPKTVPLTWVDLTVWLLTKLGIRSK